MATWFKTLGWKLLAAAAVGAGSTLATQWIVGKIKKSGQNKPADGAAPAPEKKAEGEKKP